MSGAAFTFQRMAFEALSASPPIAGGRVFDHVPERAAYPFVSLSEAESSDVSGFAADQCEVGLSISVWSQSEGFAEAAAIAEMIAQRLHRSNVPQLAGWRAVFNYERDRGLLRDPDGRTRRVLCRYRAFLERVT